MKKYEDGQATQLAQGEFFKYDFENVELPGKEYIDTLNNTSIFSDALIETIKKSGFNGDCKDKNQLISYVLNKCKTENIILSRQNIMNWLSGGMPASSSVGRENVYKLCFALGMNEQQTGEFFLKAYLERPFNYKNIAEAVYYFCLKNNLKYSDAIAWIDTIEAMPHTETESTDEATENIGKVIDSLRDEKALIKYLSENKSSFSNQNKTATEEIKRLIERCMTLAEQEHQKTSPHENLISVKNTDELLGVIYGYSARATEGFEEKKGKMIPKAVYRESISESSFPELIKRNFPQRQQFENILKGKASFDAIRKALIMLNFYYFFAEALISGVDTEDGLFDEFTDEMNEVLLKCGYVQLYWRNPYDWMVGYCACAQNPLSELRSLIDEYYLSDESIYEDR